jgi:rhamnosyltransferase
MNLITLNKIAGIVVLYNTAIEDLENLKKTISIFEKTYIINNSPEYINILDFFAINTFDNIILFNNPTNLGIAQALNKGCDFAIQDGFEWVMTLDQDSVLDLDLIPMMIDSINLGNVDLETIGIIAPLISNHGLIEVHNNQNLELIDYCITSGNLINLQKWKNVNGFDESLFIYHVDNEFCFKMYKYSFNIVRVNNAIIEHKVGDRGKVNILGKNILWDIHSSIANYYITRNTVLFVIQLLKHGKYQDCLRFIKYHLLKDNIKTLLFQSDRLTQLKYIIWGYWDAVRSKKGKL